MKQQKARSNLDKTIKYIMVIIILAVFIFFAALFIMLGTYSNKWYPWWTNAFDEGASPFQKMINIYTAKISQESGTFRVIHSYDNVPAVKDGVMERYLPTISTVYIEYRAKLLLAKTTDEFEKVWNDFKNALEQRGHWSEIKEEWHREYQNYIKQNGDY